MIEIPIKSIIDNSKEVQRLWPCLDFYGYSIMIKFLLENGYYEDNEMFYYHRDVIIEPGGNIANYYYQGLNLVPLLDDPPSTTVVVSDYNVPFIEYKDDRTIPTKFHFIRNYDNYLMSLTRKKRWKFKNELKKEGKICIKEVGVDEEFRELFKHKIIELNGEEDYLDQIGRAHV